MPLAKYKDFDDCVRRNQDKDNPAAYCGTIKNAIEHNKVKRSRKIVRRAHRMEDVERGPI